MNTVETITYVPIDHVIHTSTSSLDGWAVLVAVALLTLAALWFGYQSWLLRRTVRAIGQSAVANAFKT